ncbi:lipid-binding SYLF domain-containing protein [Desulfocurvus sp.]|jgi:lipid-binding SYLF domain-containing protein|uniref:lipid-binding SYLF domain-containing protein n=1 Tax=Desulfocurvus sp. TaxID=2871698 RepID=UPI0025C56BF6|nr:lipid-binding SYLF domain-containing protein [Desulfocurvus sp.]MCK9240666.1 lipid-binding SYLF domain-containing protein [Desulfocurvus sp.]
MPRTHRLPLRPGRLLAGLAAALILAACAAVGGQGTSAPPAAEAAARGQRVLDLAAGTLDVLLQGPQGPALRQALGRGRGVLVAPRFVKAGFLLGGAGGEAVVVGRGAGGAWGAPALVRLAGGSAGFQAGVSETAFALVLLDGPSLEGTLQNGFTLDAEMLAAAPGQGLERQVSSMTYDGGAAYFSRADGLFAGVALDGTGIFPDTEANAALYTPGATPRGLVLERSHAPAPEAARLLGVLRAAAP